MLLSGTPSVSPQPAAVDPHSEFWAKPLVKTDYLILKSQEIEHLQLGNIKALLSSLATNTIPRGDQQILKAKTIVNGEKVLKDRHDHF